MERHRQIIYFKDYFHDFFDQQVENVKDKIDYVLFLITVADRIPQKFFKHIEGTNGLYEIRVEFQSNIYRIFFAVLMRGNRLYYLMDFRKNLKRHQLENLTRP